MNASNYIKPKDSRACHTFEDYFDREQALNHNARYEILSILDEQPSSEVIKALGRVLSYLIEV